MHIRKPLHCYQQQRGPPGAHLLPSPRPSLGTRASNPRRDTQQMEGFVSLSSSPWAMGAAIQPCVPRKEEVPTCPVPSQLHVRAWRPPPPPPHAHLPFRDGSVQNKASSKTSPDDGQVPARTFQGSSIQNMAQSP